MSNRVFFDINTIENNFASFTNSDLSTKSSIFNLITSIFGKSKNKKLFDSCLNFEISPSNEYCIFSINRYIYLINLNTNLKTTSFSLLDDNLIPNAIGFTTNNKPFAIFNKDVYIYCKPNPQSFKIRLNFSNCYLFTTIFGIFSYNSSQNHISLISDDFSTQEVVIDKIPPGTICCHCQNSFALLNPSLSIISFNEESPSLSILSKRSDDSLFDVLSACFSENGKYLCLLDSPSQISIFDGLEHLSTVTSIGIISIIPWTNSHFIIEDEYGTLTFVPIKKQHPNEPQFPNQTERIKALSFLRPLQNGFLMLERTETYGDFTHFNLSRYISVSPFELFQRSCEEGNFGDAYQMMESYHFPRDIYEKAYVRKNILDDQLIDSHLTQISDKDFIIEFCKKTNANNPILAQKLIRIGLQYNPKDPELLIQQKHFILFKLVYHNLYSSDLWGKFRNCNLEEQLISWIEAKNYVYPHIVLGEKPDELNSNSLYRILSHISPFEDPEEYKSLIPFDKNYFLKRAEDIDIQTGQTSLIVSLMKISESCDDSLKKDNAYAKAQEFDTYISTIKSAQIDLKFMDYFLMSDLEKLKLFLNDLQSSEEIMQILNNEASSIIARQPTILEEIFESILTDNNTMILQKLSFEEKIVEISKFNISKEFDINYLN